MLAACEQHGIEVHIAGIFGGKSGLFDPKPEHAGVVGKWRALAERHGVSLAAVAIGFGALPACVAIGRRVI